MYCRNCGKLLNDGDKFCVSCGEPVIKGEETLQDEKVFSPQFKKESIEKEEKVVKPTGFNEKDSFKDVTEAYNSEPKKTPGANFSWDLEGFPTGEPKKTEEINFNWTAVIEEKKSRKPEIFEPENLDLVEDEKKPPEVLKKEEFTASNKVVPDGESISVEGNEPDENLEEALFEEMNVDKDPLGQIPDKIDKFYTFNKKNEEFQQLLDAEYNKMHGEKVADKDEMLAPEEPVLADATNLEPVNVEKIETEPIVSEPVDAQETDNKLPPSGEIANNIENAAESAGNSEQGFSPGVGEDAKKDSNSETGKSNVEFNSSTEAEKTEVVTGNEKRLTFDDVFPVDGDDDKDTIGDKQKNKKQKKGEKAKGKNGITFTDDEDNNKKPKKKNKALKVIAIILIVLVAIELVIIGIKYLAPDSVITEKIDGAYGTISDFFTGTNNGNGNNTPSVTAISKIIEAQKTRNVNIGTIVENVNLTFSDSVNYGFDEINSASDFTDSAWYTDDKGDTVNYGSEIIGTIISYYSTWVDKANGTNDDVLSYLKKGTKLFDRIEALKPDEDITFGINKLEIGEIKTGEKGFYIYATVTKINSKTNKEVLEKHIIYMEPVEKTMKIVEINEF